MAMVYLFGQIIAPIRATFTTMQWMALVVNVGLMAESTMVVGSKI